MFSSISQKRTSEDTTSSSPPKKASAGPKRDARQIYNPPSGKYSSNLGSFSYGKLSSLEKLFLVRVVPMVLFVGQYDLYFKAVREEKAWTGKKGV